jgi:hypothetical protein
VKSDAPLEPSGSDETREHITVDDYKNRSGGCLNVITKNRATVAERFSTKCVQFLSAILATLEPPPSGATSQSSNMMEACLI